MIASDTLDVDQILGLHAYFGGTLASGITPTDFRSAADFEDRMANGRRDAASACPAPDGGTLLTNDIRGMQSQRRHWI